MITEITVPADPEWPARVRARAHHNVSQYESCTQSIVATFMEEFGITDPLVLRAAGGMHAHAAAEFELDALAEAWTTYCRFDADSNRPYPHMALAPTLDFAAMAAGMGVPGTRVEEPDTLAGEVARAVAAGGPHLIEVRVSGKP